MKSLLNVGVEKETVRETRAAINDIINARIDNATMVAALAALQTVCNVNHMTISGCTFTTAPEPAKAAKGRKVRRNENRLPKDSP